MAFIRYTWPTPRRYVGVGEGSCGAARVGHVHQQRVLALSGAAAQYLEAGDAKEAYVPSQGR